MSIMTYQFIASQLKESSISLRTWVKFFAVTELSALDITLKWTSTSNVKLYAQRLFSTTRKLPQLLNASKMTIMFICWSTTYQQLPSLLCSIAKRSITSTDTSWDLFKAKNTIRITISNLFSNTIQLIWRNFNHLLI